MTRIYPEFLLCSRPQWSVSDPNIRSCRFHLTPSHIFSHQSKCIFSGSCYPDKCRPSCVRWTPTHSSSTNLSRESSHDTLNVAPQSKDFEWVETFVCCVKLAELMISISRTTLIFFQPVQLDVRSCVLSSSRTCISVLCQNSWKGRAYLWGGGGETELVILFLETAVAFWEEKKGG